MGCPHKEAVMEYTAGKHEGRGAELQTMKKHPHVMSFLPFTNRKQPQPKPWDPDRLLQRQWEAAGYR